MSKTFLDSSAPVSEYVRKGQSNAIQGVDDKSAILPFDLLAAFGAVDAIVLSQVMYSEYADREINGVGVRMNASIMCKTLRKTFDYKTVLASFKRLRNEGVIIDVEIDGYPKGEIICVHVAAIPLAMRARRLDKMAKIGNRGKSSDTEEGAPISDSSESVSQKRIHPKTDTPKTGNSNTQNWVLRTPKTGYCEHPKLGTKSDLYILSENNKNQINTKVPSLESQHPDTAIANDQISQQDQAQTPEQAPALKSDAVAPVAAPEPQSTAIPTQSPPNPQTAPKSAPSSNFSTACHRVYGLEIPSEHKAMLNDIYRRARTTLGDAVVSYSVDQWEAIVVGEQRRVNNAVATPNPQHRPSKSAGIFADANPHAARAYGRGPSSSREGVAIDAPPAPTSWDELMNEVMGDGQKFFSYLSSKYPAFDGQDARPSLQSVLDACKEYYVRGQRKIPLPTQVESWVSKDHAKHLAAYEESRGIYSAPAADKHGNKITLHGERRWTLDDRTAWINCKHWVQSAQAWTDSDPNASARSISADEEAAARAAVFSGMKNIGKPKAPQAAHKSQEMPVAATDQRAIALGHAIKRSEEWHRSHGDPQGAFALVGVDGAQHYFPAGYHISEVDRQCAANGYLWHPTRFIWVQPKPTSSPLVSENGDPIGAI